MIESSYPNVAQSPCRVCRKMCDSAILTGDLRKVICYSCLNRPLMSDEHSKQQLKGLQKLADIVRELDKQGVLVGAVGLTIEDREDDNS